MRVWISKYALSSGITEHEAEVRDGMAYPGEPFSSWVGFKIGIDAHETPQGAIAAAEIAKVKRLNALKRQITKLERLKFTVPKIHGA